MSDTPTAPTSSTPHGLIAVATRNPSLGSSLEQICMGCGHRVVRVDRILALHDLLQNQPIEVALVELGMLGRRRGRKRPLRELVASPHKPMVLLVPTDDAQADEALELIGAGARDVIRAPPSRHEVALRVGRALEARDLGMHVAGLAEAITESSRRSFATSSLVCESAAMQRLEATVRRVARTRSTVLIRGESGVGKELVARTIHFRSPRGDAPFIAINCAALPPHLIESELFGHERGAFTGAVERRVGKFELAHGGTLFLDEVGETDPTTQAKLLRVLEQQEFMRVGGNRPIRADVRLVAATNADLESMVDEGNFRGDLYYRLRVVNLTVPPLRERTEDLPELCTQLLERVCQRNGLSLRVLTPEARDALCRYAWPGNVRELMNTLEAIVVTNPSRTLDVEHLPQAQRGEAVSERDHRYELAGIPLAQVEADAIRATLEHARGSRTRAAELLGIGVRTLRRKIRELGLDEEIPARPGRPRKV